MFGTGTISGPGRLLPRPRSRPRSTFVISVARRPPSPFVIGSVARRAQRATTAAGSARCSSPPSSDTIMAFPLFRPQAMGIVAAMAPTPSRTSSYATAINQHPLLMPAWCRAGVNIRRESASPSPAKLSGQHGPFASSPSTSFRTVPAAHDGGRSPSNMGWGDPQPGRPGLSFIGLGVRPRPTAGSGGSHGRLRGRQFIVSGEWWLARFSSPGLARWMAPRSSTFNLPSGDVALARDMGRPAP